MKTNQTMEYFILLGLSNVPELQAPIFVLVLLIYLIVLFGNLTLILLVCLDSHLHTPMYFFLVNLSIVDMTSSTVTQYKILLTFITGDPTIPYVSCLVQSYLFGALLAQEIFILIAMSFDRYVAICRPLNYTIIMNFKLCRLFASICFILAFIQYIPFTFYISKISCFSTNVIDLFCCDLTPLMENACSDITILKIISNFQGTTVFIVIPFLLIVTSYVFIIRSIMRIRSSIGRRKAFYTCSSHLIFIALLYTTLTFHYVIPNNTSKAIPSFFNMAVVPMMNPFIYSLKNKDVTAAFKRRIVKIRQYILLFY